MLNFTQKLILNGDTSGMALVRRRMEATTHKAPGDSAPRCFDDGPLDADETAAFNAIIERMQQNIRKNNPSISPEDTEMRVNGWLNLLGRKGLLRVFVETPLIMGAPYVGFVLNFFICLAAFIYTRDFVTIFFLAPAIHAAMFLYQKAVGNRQREERLRKILTEGLPSADADPSR